MRARLGEKGEGKGRRIYPNRIFRSRRNFHCYAVAPHKKFLTLHGKSDVLDYMVKTRTHGTLTRTYAISSGDCSCVSIHGVLVPYSPNLSVLEREATASLAP